MKSKDLVTIDTQLINTSETNPVVVFRQKLPTTSMFNREQRQIFYGILCLSIDCIYKHFNTPTPSAATIETYNDIFLEHRDITIQDLVIFKNCVIRNKTSYGDSFYDAKFTKEASMVLIIDWWNIYIDYRNRVREDEYYRNKMNNEITDIPDNWIPMPDDIKEQIAAMFSNKENAKETYLDIIEMELTGEWKNELVFTNENVSALFYMCLRRKSQTAVYLCIDELVYRRCKDLGECVRLSGKYGRLELVQYFAQKIGQIK